MLADQVSERVHQGFCYYLFFHNITLSQARQAALKAYWILRYRPVTALVWEREYNINVYFAYFILFAEAMGEHLVVCPKSIQKTVVNNVLHEYEDTYIRFFSEHSIGKGAMMLISESIGSVVKAEIKLNS